MGVEQFAQHLCGLVHAVLRLAGVISQHTLLANAESPGQDLHFFASLPQELKDVLPSLSSWRSIQVHFPHRFQITIHKSFYQRILRRGAGRNSWERVYHRTEVLPQFPEAQPPLSRSRNTWIDRTRSKQHRLRHLCSIRTT